MSAPDRTTLAVPVQDLPGPGTYMCGLTWDGTCLWHSDQATQKIYAVDPAGGGVTRELDCRWVRADLAYDGRHLVQVGGRPKRLVLLDPATGRVADQREVPPGSGRLTGVEFTPDGVWMCLRDPVVVQLRDYRSMSVLREFPVPGSTPSGLTYAHGLVVYGDFQAGRLHAVRAETGEPAGSAAVPGRPTGVTYDGQHVWYCDFPARRFRALPLSAVAS
jgi:outer membrane protein assembly factor BamB